MLEWSGLSDLTLRDSCPLGDSEYYRWPVILGSIDSDNAIGRRDVGKVGCRRWMPEFILETLPTVYKSMYLPT